MSFISNLYEGVKSAASYIMESAAPIARSEGLINLVSILAIDEIYTIGAYIGRKSAASTNGALQLNSFVPLSVRHSLRKGGRRYIGGMIRRVSAAVSKITGLNLGACKAYIGAPVTEELMFRLPVLIAAWAIDHYSDEALQAPISEVINLTGADLLKGLAAVISSVGFTYVHEHTPTPERAAGVFTSGLALSAMTLRSELQGLGIAIISHAIHNFRDLNDLTHFSLWFGGKL